MSPRLKSGALNHDSSTNRTEFNSEFWLLTPEFFFGKQTIRYTSSLDALVAVAKRLSVYENQQKMESEDFFNHYNQGILPDDVLFIEWANDYRHYLALRQK